MSPVPIRSVKFWINAFIPRDIAGYTQTVPAGIHRGKTMIPGPQTVQVPTVTPVAMRTPWQHLRVGTTRVGISDCYLTDQRGFSNYIHAPSRMHSEMKVELGGPSPRMTEWHNCDPTTEVDCEDGDVEATGKGGTSRMSFTLLPSRDPASVVIQMKCAASNPCAPTSRLFGDIDYSGRIVIKPGARSIEIDGIVDAFPAFEAYATINDGAGVPLFQLDPPSGNTVMNLPGCPDRPVRFRLEDRNGDGIFEVRTRF